MSKILLDFNEPIPKLKFLLGYYEDYLVLKLSTDKHYKCNLFDAIGNTSLKLLKKR